MRSNVTVQLHAPAPTNRVISAELPCPWHHSTEAGGWVWPDGTVTSTPLGRVDADGRHSEGARGLPVDARRAVVAGTHVCRVGAALWDEHNRQRGRSLGLRPTRRCVQNPVFAGCVGELGGAPGWARSRTVELSSVYQVSLGSIPPACSRPASSTETRSSRRRERAMRVSQADLGLIPSPDDRRTHGRWFP